MNFNAVYDAYQCPSNYYWKNNFTEDDIQDACLKVLEKYADKTFSDDELVRLTFVTCQNLSNNRKKLDNLHVKREYENRALIEERFHGMSDTNKKVEDDLLEEIRISQVINYIQQKNDMLTAQIFYSYAIKKARLCDIAKKINISYSTAKNCIKNAKKSLKNIMSTDPDDYIVSFKISD